jgi:hypothetical protein
MSQNEAGLSLIINVALVQAKKVSLASISADELLIVTENCKVRECM